MPDASRKTEREVEPRKEAFGGGCIPRLKKSFRILTEPLAHDAVGAEMLADVIQRVGRGELNPADVSDELAEIYWGKDVPD